MNIALVVKATESTQDRDSRNMGWWSYAVPEFKWQHFVYGVRRVSAREMNSFDLIFQEDAGPRKFKWRRVPLVYLAIDGSLSDDHLEARLERAEQADLILVDHDDLDKYACLGKPVRRLNYCVNDKLMRDYGEPKTIDVSFHCASGGNKGRQKIREMLSTYCKKRGYTYKSGVLNITEYARAMNRSKIVVNWPRANGNRPHRVFDAMACNACLVTGRIPPVPGDELVCGRDYVEVSEIREIPDAIDALMADGSWQQIAQNGKKLISKYHTWAIRAKQLEEILQRVL